MSDEREPTPAQVAAARAQVAADLAAIDIMHERWQQCALCGQRTVRPDRFGLCSKTSAPHAAWRAGVTADEKAGVR